MCYSSDILIFVRDNTFCLFFFDDFPFMVAFLDMRMECKMYKVSKEIDAKSFLFLYLAS